MDLTHRCEGRERGVELRSGLNTGFSGVFLGPFQGLSHLNQRGFEPRDLGLGPKRVSCQEFMWQWG